MLAAKIPYPYFGPPGVRFLLAFRGFSGYDLFTNVSSSTSTYLRLRLHVDSSDFLEYISPFVIFPSQMLLSSPSSHPSAQQVLVPLYWARRLDGGKSLQDVRILLSYRLSICLIVTIRDSVQSRRCCPHCASCVLVWRARSDRRRSSPRTRTCRVWWHEYHW